jgi:hypothetical protein
MKLAIMQPYFFPYIGYFQLLASVDKFVFYDDVGYIKNGWINRNRIALNGTDHFITIPVKGGSCSKKIDAVHIDTSQTNFKRKLLNTLHSAYKKSEYFEETIPIVEEIIASDEEYISNFAKRSVLAIKEWLDIKTEVTFSSRIYNNQHLHAQERVIDINKIEKSTIYINVEGGRSLYKREAFEMEGIDLRFLSPDIAEYTQITTPRFIPGLSIIDILMNIGKDGTKNLLHSAKTNNS